MNPEDLIRHGFVNNFETNSVECLWCRLTITYEALPLCDDLDGLHRELSPRCNFLRNMQVQQDTSQTSDTTRVSNVAGFLPQERPAQLRAIECPPCRDETPRQDTPSEESKPKYQLLQTAVNTNINDPTCNTLSGTDIGLQNIMTNRSPAESSTDSSVEDSSGEQTFWREIVLCNMCKEPIRSGELPAQCHYCKKTYHRQCLETAMRMRNEYHPPPLAECIDLGAYRTRPPVPVQVTSQNDDSSCLVVRVNSNAQLAQYVTAQETQSHRSGGDKWTCADYWTILSRATNYIRTGSVRPGNELLNASLPSENLRYTCPECKAAMNRICSRCRNKLSDKPGILVVSCNACSRWYHVRCLTRKKNRGVNEDAVWICIFCDQNYASSSSSEDSA